MSTTSSTPLHAALDPSKVVAGLFRLTIEQYESIADAEMLTKSDQVELIDGLLVTKLTKKPAHSVAACAVAEEHSRLVPDGYGEIPVYWIVNLVGDCLEVYTQPESGADRSRQILQPAEEATVIIDGRKLGTVSVSDLLP